ncbi:hypothetical protein ACQSSU_20390 [Micromonospora echinospora]
MLGPDRSAKSKDVWRSLRAKGTGTRAELVATLREWQAGLGGELETTPPGVRLVFERAGAPYPSVEHYVAVGVAGVPDKERPAFDELWWYVKGLGLDRQGDLLADVG